MGNKVRRLYYSNTVLFYQNLFSRWNIRNVGGDHLHEVVVVVVVVVVAAAVVAAARRPRIQKRHDQMPDYDLFVIGKQLQKQFILRRQFFLTWITTKA